MPFILVVVFLAIVSGWGGWGAGWLRSTFAPPPPRQLVVIEPLSFETRCRERFDDARLALIARGMLREQADPARHDGDFWRSARIRTDPNPGGPGGLVLSVDGDGGERYAAGVSGPQPQDVVRYPAWHDFNRDVGAAAIGHVSLFRDESDKSGFLGALDGDHERRFDFVHTMQPAIDDCLALRP